MAGESAAIRRGLALVAILGLTLVLQALSLSAAYADHEARFRGQGGPAVDIGLIAWTAVGAVLGFGALVAAVLWWERRDEAAARKVQAKAKQEEGGP